MDTGCNMKIAIASGKGGTGKTTLAINLALALSKTQETTLVDCDVEEPNTLLFFRRQPEQVEPATVPLFSADMDACDGCGRCAEACRFNAIAVVSQRPIFFPEMCHGCGGCMLACPKEAIRESTRQNGQIRSFTDDRIHFYEGRLNIGEAMAVPMIEQVKQKATQTQTSVTILDCPPGTSCPMMATIRHCDFVLLVTEPTPFGLNDLRLAVEVVRLFRIPFGVVINRDGVGDDRVVHYCEEENIDLLSCLADDRRVAELYSQGTPAYGQIPSFTSQLDELAASLLERSVS